MATKNKPNLPHTARSRLVGYFILAGAILVGSILVARHVRADDLQPLIDAVSKQIEANQAIVNQKQAEGDTLQNKLTAVQADLEAAKANLELTRLKIKQTKVRQLSTGRELTAQTTLLGQNIAAVYRQGGISPIELIAGSDNLSQYVGQQEYYSTLRRKIDENVAKIRTVKAELDDLDTQLTIKANEVRLQTEAISVKEAELAELLGKTRGEEGAYRVLVDADKTRLSTLRAQQAAAIAAQSAGRDYSLTSEYPWAAAEPFPSAGVDPWGFYYRQCTSYAAWRRANLGKPIPSWGFLGPADAKEWPKWGKQFNMRVDAEPEVGALGVYAAGEYGHVMVVEAITQKGQQVLVSEFNASWDGRYSQSLWPVSALTFIH